MLEVSYIGDELTGTGLSLAGIRPWAVPDSAEQLWQLVLEERERRHLVVLSSECAHVIQERLSRLLELHPIPPVVVLPRPDSDDTGNEVIDQAFTALGIEDL